MAAPKVSQLGGGIAKGNIGASTRTYQDYFEASAAVSPQRPPGSRPATRAAAKRLRRTGHLRTARRSRALLAADAAWAVACARCAQGDNAAGKDAGARKKNYADVVNKCVPRRGGAWQRSARRHASACSALHVSTGDTLPRTPSR